MKLKEYFIKERINPVAFSLESEISVTTIYRYLSGGRPHFKNACKIEKITLGKVTVEELLPGLDK